MVRPVRVAIVGAGNVARLHAEGLCRLGGRAQLVAAMDVDPDRLAAFCDEHGIPGRYSDLDELLAEAEPGLVHLCTPPALHFEQARRCLEAGVSVLVEKPPTLSLRQLDELAAMGSAGPWLATVFQHRFGSGARRLRALASSGVLGRPLLAICHTTWFRDQAYFDVAWRGRWESEGGGPTMGHGIHQMDLLLSVLGDWAEVSAVVRRQARRTQTEDLSLAHVILANGAVASVVNSVLSPREESYLRFDFERATVELRHLYGYGDADWRLTPAPGAEEVLDAWEAGERGIPSGHRSQFAEVLRSLEEGAPPPVTPAESRRTMALVAGIYASGLGGGPVTPADLEGSPFYDRMDGGGARW
ncbi:MAG TPA: Gfo/Idh/MocA family oxidoreductase [Candidatus Dormibacteraeota bacterium]|nr:Gfo/Idh/MocA family oxidoreductase [Candidatus Dormibacteraeota bacterium]